jgi:hypothetical protein
MVSRAEIWHQWMYSCISDGWSQNHPEERFGYVSPGPISRPGGGGAREAKPAAYRRAGATVRQHQMLAKLPHEGP